MLQKLGSPFKVLQKIFRRSGVRSKCSRRSGVLSRCSTRSGVLSNGSRRSAANDPFARGLDNLPLAHTLLPSRMQRQDVALWAVFWKLSMRGIETDSESIGYRKDGASCLSSFVWETTPGHREASPPAGRGGPVGQHLLHLVARLARDQDVLLPGALQGVLQALPRLEGHRAAAVQHDGRARLRYHGPRNPRITGLVWYWPFSCSQHCLCT